jgi:hypothetical protein
MTILGPAAKHTRLGRAFLRVLNRRGTFGNLDDTEAGLRAILERSFRDVRVELTGPNAVFLAAHPKASLATTASSS